MAPATRRRLGLNGCQLFIILYDYSMGFFKMGLNRIFKGWPRACNASSFTGVGRLTAGMVTAVHQADRMPVCHHRGRKKYIQADF